MDNVLNFKPKDEVTRPMTTHGITSSITLHLGFLSSLGLSLGLELSLIQEIK